MGTLKDNTAVRLRDGAEAFERRAADRRVEGKVTRDSLMANSAAMREWLEGKRPDDIVATSMGSTNYCLGGYFFRENGLEGQFPLDFGLWPWFDKVFTVLTSPGPDGCAARITAEMALKAIRKVEGF